MPTITAAPTLRPTQPVVPSAPSPAAPAPAAATLPSAVSEFVPAQPSRPPVVLSPAPVTADPSVRLTGTVTLYDWERGAGYIRPAGGGPEVFVHYSGIDMQGYKYLEPGWNVSFGIRPGVNGKPEAFEVRQL